MTTQAIRYPEWRDENRHRKYPFADTASLTASDGSTIQNDVFLDARLYPIGGGARQFLSKITVTSGYPVSLVFTFSDESGVLCTGEYSLADPEETIWLYDAYGRPAGVLVTSMAQLSGIVGWQAGSYTFTVSDTELAASVVVPIPVRGVSAMVTDADVAFNGDVWLVGGPGVVLREDGAGIVRVDVVGDPYATRTACDREGTAVEVPRFLKRINGMLPDARGNFTFAIGVAREDNVVRIDPETAGVHLYLAGAS